MMHQLTLNRTFPIPLAQLFDAWKKPEVIQQWFAPSTEMHVPETDVDFQQGGKYRIVMQNADGTQFIVGGEYLEIEELQRLVFTWKWETSPNTTKVELDFKTINKDSSELTLVHSEFLDQGEKERHEQGWMGCLGILQELDQSSAAA